MKSVTIIEVETTLDIAHSDLGQALEDMGLPNTEENQDKLGYLLTYMGKYNQLSIPDLYQLYNGDMSEVPNMLNHGVWVQPVTEVPTNALTHLTNICK